VSWYLSQDAVGSGDAILLYHSSGVAGYNHAGIAANGPDFTVDRVLPSALPSGWSGSNVYIVMKTDSASQVAESNESNNFGQIANGYDRDPITITTPTTVDLQGYDCYATDAAQWGQTISIQSQVRNAGSGASGAFQVCLFALRGDSSW